MWSFVSLFINLRWLSGGSHTTCKSGAKQLRAWPSQGLDKSDILRSLVRLPPIWCNDIVVMQLVGLGFFRGECERGRAMQRSIADRMLCHRRRLAARCPLLARPTGANGLEWYIFARVFAAGATRRPPFALRCGLAAWQRANGTRWFQAHTCVQTTEDTTPWRRGANVVDPDGRF